MKSVKLRDNCALESYLKNVIDALENGARRSVTLKFSRL